VERLQRILRNARDIKQVIQRVGEQMAPSSAHVQKRQGDRRRSLVGRRILVVDADEQVRAAAHALLERCGATVETARDGAEAVRMVRADNVKRDGVKTDGVKTDSLKTDSLKTDSLKTDSETREAERDTLMAESGPGYDVIISDIRLPDISGYQLLVRLQELLAHVPLVLMTGFGYDPGHSIVKARQAGIDLVLFKPFRVDQLLDTVEKAVARHEAAATAAK
jgi:CheY-like chemotaxis protein